MFTFLLLVVSWKQEQKLGELTVTDQVLAFWSQLLQELLFGFLAGLPEKYSDLLQV